MPQYTQANLQSDILGDNIDAPSGIQGFMNRSIRSVIGDLDLRSTKRKSSLSPQMYKKLYDYGNPADMKDTALIDLKIQVNRGFFDEFELTSPEEFDRRKLLSNNICAITDADFVRLLRISADVPSKESIIHNCDSITGDGTWAASGDGDNSSLVVDNVNFLNGSGSLKFNAAGGSTTSIFMTNSTMQAVDLTQYNPYQIFLWVYIPTITGLTSFKLRWGSSSSNYYEQTVTTNNEGLAFYVGWNLLRFEWGTATTSGTPDVTSITYARIEIVKTSGMAATTGWRIDYLVARVGVIFDVIYYTKYGWQTSAGAYIENSTTTTDKLNCDTEEYDLFVLKGKQIVFEELRMFNEAGAYQKQYETKRDEYKIKYPSERKSIDSTYLDFGTAMGGTKDSLSEGII